MQSGTAEALSHGPRDERRSGLAEPSGPRNAAQRDRDRVLYSPALRRLAEVTQVVAPTEGYVFHNRLTHTLEVAQIGRRIAEKLTANAEGRALAEQLGGISADVVEAAALVHDLGHPPFGHIAEQKLNQLLSRAHVHDGHEGNAHSFRIVNTLEVHATYDMQFGLDLTRATLNASLKYPWVKPQPLYPWLNDVPEKYLSKWGAYLVEHKAFEWVRADQPFGAYEPSLEARLMDWADDVAYSVHDMEDFFRAGMIPLDRIVLDEKRQGERQLFYSRAFARYGNKDIDGFKKGELFDNFDDLLQTFEVKGPYDGSREQAAQLNEMKSNTIGFFVNAVDISEESNDKGGHLDIDPIARKQVLVLKELIWVYVINDPALGVQQEGLKRVIERLFEDFGALAFSKGGSAKLPKRFGDRVVEVRTEQRGRDELTWRIVADLIASMTEQQALTTYERLTGLAPGSALDRLI